MIVCSLSRDVIGYEEKREPKDEIGETASPIATPIVATFETIRLWDEVTVEIETSTYAQMTEHLLMVCAHAEWTTQAQINSVKTAVSSLTKQSFQWHSSGIVMQGKTTKDITLLENWIIKTQHES